MTSWPHLQALVDAVVPNKFVLETEECLIGRSPELCDVVVDIPFVSRIHVKIVRKGSHYVLQHLGRHPTFVSGKRVEGEYILNNQDAIGLTSAKPLLSFVDMDATRDPFIVSSTLVLKEEEMRFYLHSKEVILTPSQYRLMLHLYLNRGRVCSREECAGAVWGEENSYGMEMDNLDKVIYGIRKGLSRIDPDCDFIHTERGVGFILKE